MFLDTRASVSSTSSPVSPSSISDTFGFSFCQRPWDLTKRRDDTVVADMVADMAADMEVHMMADMEMNKVANIVDKKGTQFQSCKNVKN